jgi:hypothetical protein
MHNSNTKPKSSDHKDSNKNHVCSQCHPDHRPRVARHHGFSADEVESARANYLRSLNGQ